MRVGTTKLIEARCQAEKMATEVLALADGFRKTEAGHKRCIKAYEMLRRAADELQMAQANL